MPLDKPAQTPPELRRRKVEKEAEGHRFYDEKTKDGRVMEEAEIRQLEAIAHECDQLEAQAVAAERWCAVDQRLGTTGESQGRHTTGMRPDQDPVNTRNGRHQYSVMKAMRSRMDPQRYPLNGLELETHLEMAKERVAQGLKAAQGIMIPHDLALDLEASERFARRSGLMGRLREMRALDTTAGAGSIPTILDTTMIEYLRARMVTRQMGARVMTDMQGLFAIPRQSGIATFYMVTQGVSVTASNQTIDQVPFSPHTGGAYTTYTRQFLEQTNQDAEMFTREDLSAVVARGVETQGLNGQGSSGYPLGIMQNPLIDVVAIGTNGGNPTWAQLINQEAHVAYFNADVGSLGYITDALVRATLKVTLKVGSTYPIYLWNTEAPDYPVNGYPCAITNLLPQTLTKGSSSGVCHAMIFGNWEDLIYAFWSGLDVIVDPYTSAAQGAVNIVALQDFDVNVRHYQSFSNCVDITLATGITVPLT